MQVRVQVNPAQLAAVQRTLNSGRRVDKVLRRAVTKVARYARTRVVESLYEVINLKKAEVRAGVTVINLKGAPAAVIKVPDKRYPLIMFVKGDKRPPAESQSWRQRRGVTWQTRRDRPPQTEVGTFIQVAKGGRSAGKPHVWERMSEKRYPIKRSSGVSLGEIYEEIPQLAKGAFENAIAGRLSMEVDRQVRVLLEQEGGR
jgi:hypothetical protein